MLAVMTDLERELKAEEITRALRAALPGEPPRALAVLLRRAVVRLELEAARPAPERKRPEGIRWSDRPVVGAVLEPRVFRAHCR
jgi:hypothetical protein